MLAESIKNILAGLALDFMDGGANQRTVYLYKDDLKNGNLLELPDGKVIQVTFKYVNDPNKED